MISYFFLTKNVPVVFLSFDLLNTNLISSLLTSQDITSYNAAIGACGQSMEAWETCPQIPPIQRDGTAPPVGSQEVFVCCVGLTYAAAGKSSYDFMRGKYGGKLQTLHDIHCDNARVWGRALVASVGILHDLELRVAVPFWALLQVMSISHDSRLVSSLLAPQEW